MLKKAFTMAEIMIAMSIIGTISVLVLPSVTTGTSSKQFLTTYKKTLAVINQAVDTNYAMSGWDFAGTRANSSEAVELIMTERLGAVKDVDTKWTIRGVAGSGYNSVCQAMGSVPRGKKCFGSDMNSSDMNRDIVINVNSEPFDTTVFTMKDGLASLIMMSVNFRLGNQLPCSAEGQKTWDGLNSYTTKANYCLAYLDLNGPKGPNRIVSCSNGIKNEGILSEDIDVDGCIISSKISDVIPVILYGDTITPATAAGVAIFREQFKD